MKAICSSFALTLLFAANAVAQPPAPTVKITCTVNYEFVQNHVRDSGNAPTLTPQGDYFSGRNFFVTRRSVDLYPKKIVSSGRYKVTLNAAMHSFLSNACTENIGQVLSYIDSHEFEAMQNVFYLVEKSSPIPPGAVRRQIGDWHLASWNNRVDRRAD
ncbi:MAG: hypothetical protein ABI114_00995 [Rhodanobacter sp.]